MVIWRVFKIGATQPSLAARRRPHLLCLLMPETKPEEGIGSTSAQGDTPAPKPV